MLIVICDLVFAVEAEKKAKAAAEEAEKLRQQNQAAQQAQVNQVSNYCWKTWMQQTLSVKISWRTTTKFVIKALFTICLTLDTEQRIALNSGMGDYSQFSWPSTEQRIALNGSMGDFIHNFPDPVLSKELPWTVVWATLFTIFLTQYWAKNCLER